MFARRALSVCLLLLVAVSVGRAQVLGPKPPGKYRATVRYSILAPRDIHVAQYDSLIQHLQKLNFEFDPPLEDHPGKPIARIVPKICSSAPSPAARP